MGMCRVTKLSNGIEYQCNFIVVPGNELALLGMPDCEQLQLLNVACQITNEQCKRRKNNEKKTKEDRSNNLKIKCKIKQEIDYFN